MRTFVAIGLVLAACGGGGRPTAVPGAAERFARAGETLEFDGTGSRGSITTYSWDFGDGSEKVDMAKASHKYDSNGNYTATLRVTGPGGAHSASVLVTVGMGCPAVARINIVTTDPKPNNPVIIGSADSTGCMGAALTKYEWDFGDGATVTGDSSKATVSHTYASANTYMVSLKVVDADGNEGRSTYALGVGVVATGKPIITSCPSNLASAAVNRAIQFSALATDPGQMQMTYAWTFSDGATATGSTVSHAFTTTGMKTATVVVTTADSRMSDPCTRTVNVTALADYSGTWILSPSGTFSGNCPTVWGGGTVNFPTGSVQVFHGQSTDGGPDFLIVTPNGGTYPTGNELRGNEESPGNFLVTRMTPNENGGGSCSSPLTTQHSIRFTFSSDMDVTGNWTKVYNAGQVMCGCVAGGSVNGAFTGFKN